MNGESLERAREYAAIVREKLGDRLKQVILFGSRARGDAWEGSDYDVIVVVDRRGEDIRAATLDASGEMMDRHEIRVVALLYDEREWRRAQDFPIGWNVRQEGVAV